MLLCTKNSTEMEKNMSYNNPLINYNFLLRVNGVNDIPCKSVHGFSKEYEYEYIREGGVNDYVHIRRKPSQKPGSIQIERYVDDTLIDNNTLRAGAFFQSMLLFVSMYPGEFKNAKRIYSFTGCVVTKVDYGELSSEKGGLLTEIVTIEYETMICTDNILSEEKKEWKLDGKKVEGKGTRYAKKLNDYGIDTVKEKESRKWPLVSSHRDITKYLK